MRLRYSAAARLHLRSIFEFLSDRNPVAARRILLDIRQSAERLRDFPRLGREGLAAGTREWIVRGSPYLIVYEIWPSPEEIVILGVFHGAQDREERLRERR